MITIEKEGRLHEAFHQKLLAVLLSFCLLVPRVSIARAAGRTITVSPETGLLTYGDPQECAEVCANMTSGWYTVFEDITISEKVTITGDVNIILRGGLTFKANDGINVPEGSKLTVWSANGRTDKMIAVSRSGGAGIGSLDGEIGGEIVINGGYVQAKGATGGAGIGGGSGESAGFSSITIGGYSKVVAQGYYGGAGIGGGLHNNHMGPIVINNGCLITAQGGTDSDYVDTDGGAGIGAGADRGSNTITINGGSVTATGGGGAAGIGGGDEGTAGEIIIHDGTITATGNNGGAGIGGGDNKSCGKVTITGGSINASGKKGGAGIGSGQDGDFDGTVNISGGFVHATGDPGDGSAGIGAGYNGNCTENSSVTISGVTVEAWGWDGAAGIGGGDEIFWGIGGEGTNVTITGGTIDARAMGNSDTRAIGAGGSDSVSRSLSIPANYKVVASDDITDRKIQLITNRVNACQTMRFAVISPCDHRGEPTYHSLTEQTHLRASCPYCGHGYTSEPHTFDIDSATCTVCGYNGTLQTVRFRTAREEGDTFIIEGYMSETNVVRNFPFTLPESKYKVRDDDHVRFAGWKAEGMAPVDHSQYVESGIYPPRNQCVPASIARIRSSSTRSGTGSAPSPSTAMAAWAR